MFIAIEATYTHLSNVSQLPVEHLVVYGGVVGGQNDWEALMAVRGKESKSQIIVPPKWLILSL